MTDKHPISRGMEREHILCWREHNPGYVCILPEGHEEWGEDRDAATDAAYDAIKPLGTWPMAVNAVEAARPIIIREEQKRLTKMIQDELDNGHSPDAILRWMQAGFAWSVRDL